MEILRVNTGQNVLTSKQASKQKKKVLPECLPEICPNFARFITLDLCV